MDASAGGGIREPVECMITVNGTEILEFYPYLREARVKMSRSAAATCTLIFDSLRTESGQWLVQDSGVFLPWREILVEARFGSRTDEVMRGYIKEVKVENPNDMSASKVTITGQDESFILDREHVHRTWSTASEPMTDGDIATQIAGDHGFRGEVDAGLTNTSLGQDGTYVRLLQERAEANGFEFFVRAQTLHFRPPQLEAEPQPTIMVYAGSATNCLSFNARYDGHRPDQVRVVRAAEAGTGNEDATVSPNLVVLGREAANSEGAGQAPFVWNLQRPGGATVAEVQARAQAAANENAWKITADGELDGVLYGHVLLTHGTVEVDGVGDVYGGRYYVDEVEHTFSLDGYRQKFKLLRNATGQDAEAGSHDPVGPSR